MSRPFDPREPFYLQWHLTDRCNLRCGHCYVDTARPEPEPADLAAVLDGFADLVARLGRPRARLQLAGGEPLATPRLFDVLALAARAGLETRVLTNGTLVDAAAAAALRDHGVRVVQVSIDGARATHDALRGPDAFDRALAGARYLREAGLQVTFAMTLSRRTAADVPAVFELARAHADRLGFHRLVACGRGRALAADILDPAALRQTFAAIAALRAHAGRLEVVLRDPLWRAWFGCTPRPGETSGCSAGLGGLAVDVDGTVLACRRMPVTAGNAYAVPLAELWWHPALVALRDRDALAGRCGDCALRWACGGCRAVAFAATGSPLSEDPQCFREIPASERVLAAACRLAVRLLGNSHHGGG